MNRVPAELQIEIQDFLNREAQILDEYKFREWLDLFTDDVVYRLPVRQALAPGAANGSPHPVFCLYDDDKNSLKLRTMRLETGMAHAEIPASVTHRMVSNVVLRPAQTPEEFDVSSNFIVHQERLGRHMSVFIGRRVDRFRPIDGGWKIARRDIDLAQTVLPSTISIFF